jgi:hypothetical protein
MCHRSVLPATLLADYTGQLIARFTKLFRHGIRSIASSGYNHGVQDSRPYIDPGLIMPKNLTLSQADLEKMDRVYREGGLRRMASPHIHYQEPSCPHPGCDHKMEWIDFQLELHGDAEGLYKPLVTAWWEGRGFAGRCPACQGWVLFTTLGMKALSENEAKQLPCLPDNWHTVAQFG